MKFSHHKMTEQRTTRNDKMEKRRGIIEKRSKILRRPINYERKRSTDGNRLKKRRKKDVKETQKQKRKDKD